MNLFWIHLAVDFFPQRFDWAHSPNLRSVLIHLWTVTAAFTFWHKPFVESKYNNWFLQQQRKFLIKSPNMQQFVCLLKCLIIVQIDCWTIDHIFSSEARSKCAHGAHRVSCSTLLGKMLVNWDYFLIIQTVAEAVTVWGYWRLLEVGCWDSWLCIAKMLVSGAVGRCVLHASFDMLGGSFWADWFFPFCVKLLRIDWLWLAGYIYIKNVNF